MALVVPARKDWANMPWTFLIREFVIEAGTPMKNQITKHLKNCLNLLPTMSETSFPSKEAILKVMAAFTPSRANWHARY